MQYLPGETTQLKAKQFILFLVSDLNPPSIENVIYKQYLKCQESLENYNTKTPRKKAPLKVET